MAGSSPLKDSSTWPHVAWIEISVTLVSTTDLSSFYDDGATAVVFAAVKSVWLDVRIWSKTVHPRKLQFLYCVALPL
jgi:hypothetical protein